MKMIVAADQNWGIGKNGQLLVRIPADMKRFREETEDKVVLMGRKTYESFENGMPLQNRTNIVLTGNVNYKKGNILTVHSLEEALEEIERYSSEDVYCIGGDSVYRMFLPYCDTIYVTKIEYAYEADRYFPNLDELPEWKLTARSEEQTYFNLEYEFRKYEKR